jgi:hypothetical protein
MRAHWTVSYTMDTYRFSSLKRMPVFSSKWFKVALKVVKIFLHSILNSFSNPTHSMFYFVHLWPQFRILVWSYYKSSMRIHYNKHAQYTLCCVFVRVMQWFRQELNSQQIHQMFNKNLLFFLSRSFANLFSAEHQLQVWYNVYFATFPNAPPKCSIT